MLGLVVTISGTMYKKDFSEPLFRSVGEVLHGNVEIVRPMGLPNPYVMLVNEEGKLRRLSMNPVGTLWYGYPQVRDIIVGNLVVMKEAFTDDGPDIVGLTNRECLNIIGRVSEITQGRYKLVDMEGATE